MRPSRYYSSNFFFFSFFFFLNERGELLRGVTGRDGRGKGLVSVDSSRLEFLTRERRFNEVEYMNTTRINESRRFFFFSSLNFSHRFEIVSHRPSSRFTNSRIYSLRAEGNFLARTSQASLSIDATYFSFVATGGSYFRINANEKKKAKRAFLPTPPLSPWRRFRRRHRLTNRRIGQCSTRSRIRGKAKV